MTTRFAAADAVEETFLVESSSSGGVAIQQTDFLSLYASKNEPEEVDPDPNKSRRRRVMLTVLTARVATLAKNEPEEVDPDPNKSIRLPAMGARLVLLPSRPAGLPTKNEPEEVDPDPNKSVRVGGRVVDGWLAVVDGSASRRGAVSFRLADSGASLDPLYEWLVAVLDVEVARSRLVAPGSGDHRLRLLEYESGS